MCLMLSKGKRLREMIISLTGFMGCGKSSIGRELAAMTGWRLIDLDGWIEEHEGRSVGAIFAEEGERAFRRMEVKYLRQIIDSCNHDRDVHGDGNCGNGRGKGSSGDVDVLDQAPVAHGTDIKDSGGKFLVIALGGGTLTSPEAERLVHSETYCIYLRAGIETLLYNLVHWPGDRPMLGGNPDINVLRGRVEELMAERAPVYERAACRIVDMDGREYAEVTKEIRNIIRDLK